jgi:arabinose-5-phosphate isomerase
MNIDLKIAKKTVKTEIQALKKLSASFNYSSQFSKAVSICSKTKNKIVVVGVGKSFIISLKVASTLSSLGSPAVGFSANDLQHGGLGFLSKNDTLLIFSVSGESSELNSILRYANRFNLKVIGVSCKSSSMLLRYATVKILLPKVNEAGFALAPTASTTMLCCFGDALGIALMKRKKFTNKKFVTTHPSGALATALIQVKEIMAKDKEIPLISSNKNMFSAVREMTKKKLGLICCREKNGKINILTDGDIRRNSNNLYKKKISKICNKNPNWISDSATALSAIEIMNSKKITSLLVSKKKYINKKIKKVIGVIHMHHCLSRGIK